MLHCTGNCVYITCILFAILEAQMSQKQFHQEFNPPPEGSITGVQNQEQITTVTDPAYDEQQVAYYIFANL